jgi:hypothetical protein
MKFPADPATHHHWDVDERGIERDAERNGLNGSKYGGVALKDYG